MGHRRVLATSTASLREAGLKRTLPRTALLAALEAADRPLTVEELRAGLPGPRPGVPTTYRNLQRFVQEGWAEAIPGPDQVLRFVRCRCTGHHHHIQCERCGRTTEVEGCGLGPALKAFEKASGFRITRHQLALYGLCEACARLHHN